MSASTLERTVFATPRAAEFFEIRSLQTRTGQHWSRSGDVVVKELADNAMDAAEQAGAPELEIIEEQSGDFQLVTVIDNGRGIAAETIRRILDYNVLASDKSAYRSPTRGMQGNAWKTLIGIPAALGVNEPIVIESQGLRHEIAAALDPAGNVVVTYPDPQPSPRITGTGVTLPLPARVRVAGGETVPLRVAGQVWAERFALINPHATIRYLACGDDPEDAVFYEPQVSDGWAKPTAADKLVPAWYDLAAFRRLVFSHIGAARSGARDVPVGEFVRSFSGLSSSGTVKKVVAAVPGITHLSGFADRPGAVASLLDMMQAVARAPKPDKLGHVPEGHYQDRLDDWYGVEEWWFRRKRHVDSSGMPWVLEVAVASTAIRGSVTYAVNYSPGFGDPLGGTDLDAGGVRCRGAHSFLERSDAAPADDNGQRRAAVIHIITPAIEPTDSGKVKLEIPPDVAREFADTIASATRVLREDAKRRERDARRAARQVEQRQETRRRETRISKKEAVFAVIPEAVRRQRGDTDLPFSAHTLFYVIRPLANEYAGRVLDLDPKYVEQTLLPEYQRIHGPIDGLYYDPGGELHEPHRGRTVRLEPARWPSTRRPAGRTTRSSWSRRRA